MNCSRILGAVALPLALSMGACNDNNDLYTTTSTSYANLRMVNGISGAPGVASVDAYFQASGTSAPSTPFVGNLAYGTATDYVSEAGVSGTVVVRAAGSGSGGTALATCPIPGMVLNVSYSVVFVYVAGVVNCELFQDVAFSSTPQYRAHDASPKSALSSVAGFGMLQTPAAPAGSTFTVSVPEAQGNLSAGAAAVAAWTLAQPNGVVPFTATSVTFAVGAQQTGTGPALATVDSRYLFSPSGTTQPNTTGGLNVAGSVGTSVFALDCTSNIAPTVPCSGGVALVGFTDRL